jgi:hypothetical protein
VDPVSKLLEAYRLVGREGYESGSVHKEEFKVAVPLGLLLSSLFDEADVV